MPIGISLTIETTIFTYISGIRVVDAKEAVPVERDTTYLLVSHTQAFMSAAYDILVDEGKLR